MNFIYSVLIRIAWVPVWISQFFSSKMQLFVSGRKETFSLLSEKLSASDKTIWFHCASLGEYEQGVPVMEELKKIAPTHKLVVTFFSPSGYEVKKNNSIADVVVYLPWDTKKNTDRFLQLVHPTIAVFVKYEIWVNHINTLHQNKIPSFLISALFRDDQIFFKPYGRFLKNALQKFTHIFVQDEHSKSLSGKINLTRVSISGDTRFDRVLLQTQKNNKLPFIEDFKKDALCLVCGSTWQEDEAVLIDYINTSKGVKIIIAPHQISASKIADLRSKITKKTVLFSEKEDKNLSDFDVFIIDTVGLLTKIYSYADIAYVGGAMGNTGLHNILEPATFGVPIVIGKNYENFPEAKNLLENGSLFSVKTPLGCSAILYRLVNDDNFRNKAGKIAKDYIKNNTGATRKIVDFIENLKLL